MKILLISNRQELGEVVRTHFSPHGSELIQYWNPIKAMDNLDEIRPDVVLFSVQDFPRHWKPFITFLRDQRGRDESVFVLLRGPDLAEEEAEKAQHLAVNALVSEDLSDAAELDRLKEVVGRYKKLDEGRMEHRYVPHDPDDIAFAFTHPTSFEILTGRVLDLSTTGIRVVPHSPEGVTDIEPGTRLDECSLQLGESIISINCTLVRAARELAFRFEHNGNGSGERIREYIQGSPERLMQAQAT